MAKRKSTNNALQNIKRLDIFLNSTESKDSLEDLLETLSSRSQYVCNSIKTFDFSTLYTAIRHTLLKSRIKKNDSALFPGEQRYLVSCVYFKLKALIFFFDVFHFLLT
jgi:hypothetical protein